MVRDLPSLRSYLAFEPLDVGSGWDKISSELLGILQRFGLGTSSCRVRSIEWAAEEEGMACLLPASCAPAFLRRLQFQLHSRRKAADAQNAEMRQAKPAGAKSGRVAEEHPSAWTEPLPSLRGRFGHANSRGPHSTIWRTNFPIEAERLQGPSSSGGFSVACSRISGFWG